MTGLATTVFIELRFATMKFVVADDPVAALAESDRDLDETVAREILALGADAVPRLFEIAEIGLTSEEWSWGSVHAARLLIELGIESTFDRLIRVYLAPGCDQEQFAVFVNGCPALGRPFLDHAFALLEKEPEHAVPLVYLVCNFDRDPRVEALLAEVVETHPRMLDSVLCSSPDPARLPIMLKALENLIARGASYGAFLDFANAIEEVGGELPEVARVPVAEARREWVLACERVCRGEPLEQAFSRLHAPRFN